VISMVFVQEVFSALSVLAANKVGMGDGIAPESMPGQPLNRLKVLVREPLRNFEDISARCIVGRCQIRILKQRFRSLRGPDPVL
jgi:hypothetical protein